MEFLVPLLPESNSGPGLRERSFSPWESQGRLGSPPMSLILGVRLIR